MATVCCCLGGGGRRDRDKHVPNIDPVRGGAWLHKRNRHGRWDRRFAIVRDGRLQFYHRKQNAAAASSSGGGAAPSFMKLAGCTARAAERRRARHLSLEDGGLAESDTFAFVVAHALRDETRHLRVAHEKHRLQWLKALKAAIAAADEAAATGDGGDGDEPSCEGWLYKKGGTTVRAAGARRDTTHVTRTGIRHNWRRRWFELRGATLRYYKSPPAAGRPLGKVHVAGATVRVGRGATGGGGGGGGGGGSPRSPGGGDRFPFTVTSSDGRTTRAYYAEKHAVSARWVTALRAAAARHAPPAAAAASDGGGALVARLSQELAAEAGPRDPTTPAGIELVERRKARAPQSAVGRALAGDDLASNGGPGAGGGGGVASEAIVLRDDDAVASRGGGGGGGGGARGGGAKAPPLKGDAARAATLRALTALRALARDPRAKTGTLLKKGGGSSRFGRRNWKRRFFVLDPDARELLYFADSTLGKGTKGVVPLDAESAVVQSGATTHKYGAAHFAISHPRRPPLQLRGVGVGNGGGGDGGGGAEEATAWVMAIERVIAGCH